MIGTYPQLVLAGVSCLGVLAVAHGALTKGELVAFITLQLRLNWPLMAMGWLIAGTEETVAATARLFEVMDSTSDITDPERPAAVAGLPAGRRRPAAGPAAVRDGDLPVPGRDDRRPARPAT